ncbi:MAG: inositol monophosphatase family protein [Neisseria sp.]|nr:inositol monophosphatase family protein [Neisseria sp.]
MSPILNTALRAARRAGSMMLRTANQIDAIRVDQKALNDFVSDVDREAEQILVEGILSAYPHHVIRSEEGGYFRAIKRGDEIEIVKQDNAPKNPDYEWIIDPLDGTTNYLHGHPQYAISMALRHRGVLTEALVFAPERNDLYLASRGEGATLNERRIRVSKRERLNEALIATGFPVVDHSVSDVYFAILQDMLTQTAGARREGSAALDLCNLAAGRFDGFFEFNLKPWDMAAGALIVQEAGGLVTDFQGEGNWLESGNICAGNAKMLAHLLRIIGAHTTAV